MFMFPAVLRHEASILRESSIFITTLILDRHDFSASRKSIWDMMNGKPFGSHGSLNSLTTLVSKV